MGMVSIFWNKYGVLECIIQAVISLVKKNLGNGLFNLEYMIKFGL